MNDMSFWGASIGIALTIFLIFFALWIWMIVYATRKKGVLGFCLTFFLGFIGWIIVLCLPADKERERERRNFGAGFAISNTEKNYWVAKLLGKVKSAVFAWRKNKEAKNSFLLFNC